MPQSRIKTRKERKQPKFSFGFRDVNAEHEKKEEKHCESHARLAYLRMKAEQKKNNKSTSRYVWLCVWRMGASNEKGAECMGEKCGKNNSVGIS